MPNTKTYSLFTDASANPQSKIGVGGYILVENIEFLTKIDQIDKSWVDSNILINCFNDVSSTKVEILTIIWAIKEVQIAIGNQQINLFTDSQCVAELLDRRRKLESSNFIAKSSGKELNNADLYKEFYRFYDSLDLTIFKIKGHSKSSTHDIHSRIFSYLDRKVRKKLREIN